MKVKKNERIKIAVVLFSPLIILFIYANILYYFFAIKPLIEINRIETSVRDLNVRLAKIVLLQKDRENIIKGYILNKNYNHNQTQMILYEQKDYHNIFSSEEINQLQIITKNLEKDNKDLYTIYQTYASVIDTIIKGTKIYYNYKINDVEIYRFLLSKLIFLIVLENANKEMLLNLLLKKETNFNKKIYKEILESIELQNVYIVGLLNISHYQFKDKIAKIKVSEEIQNIREGNLNLDIDTLYKIYSDRIHILLNFYEEHDNFLMQFIENYKNILVKNFLLITFVGLFPFILFVWSVFGIRKYYRTLESIAYKDGLTNLLNIRNFWEIFELIIQKNQRDKNCVSLIILDLDNFKSINDTFGHDVGNLVLIHVAEVILKKIDQNKDYAFRYGGDEFIIIKKFRKKEEIVLFIEELKKEIQFLNIELNQSKIQIFIGISIGVSIFPDDSTNPKELFKIADQFLLTAKKNGKNQTFSSLTEKA